MATSISAPITSSIQSGPTLPAAALSKGGITATPGFNTTPAQVDAAQKSGWSPAASAPAGVSPTVLSDSNIRDTVIPGLVSKSSTLAPTPTVPPPTTPDGSNGAAGDGKSDTNTYGIDSSNLDYGDIYNKVFGVENSQPQDPQTTQALDTLKALGTSNDASFANQMATIHNQYTQLMQGRNDANAANSDKEMNFLLANKGGNAFRTSTGSTVMNALHNGQISALSDLQTKENNAIAKIQDAQSKSDYATMQKETVILDKVQTAKKSLAAKISDTLLSANQKLAASKLKTTKDNAIAHAFTSGTTDPEGILNAVNTDKSGNDTGLNVTLAEVNTAINDMSNGDTKGLTGAVGDYYSMKSSGTLPSNIKSLPEDQQLKSFIQMEKASTSKTASATKPLYTTAKGVAVTKSDIESGVEKLDASKGADGYVDPKTYQAMYQYWEDQGLPPEAFVKNYPPKYYINPSDTTLPSYLRPTSAKSGKTPLSLPASLQNTSPSAISASGSFSP